MEHTIEFDQECKSCGGTGLYVGFAERDGAAVVCQTCTGEGHHKTVFVCSDFEYRKIRRGVKRVVQVNPGICIGRGGNNALEDFGGIAYRDWLAGAPFPPGSEMRRFTCPVWWYQCADYEQKPDWDECGLGSFSQCFHFPNKAMCWERWDVMHKEKPCPR